VVVLLVVVLLVVVLLVVVLVVVVLLVVLLVREVSRRQARPGALVPYPLGGRVLLRDQSKALARGGRLGPGDLERDSQRRRAVVVRGSRSLRRG
jgi:hypothetical protein